MNITNITRYGERGWSWTGTNALGEITHYRTNEHGYGLSYRYGIPNNEFRFLLPERALNLHSHSAEDVARIAIHWTLEALV